MLNLWFERFANQIKSFVRVKWRCIENESTLSDLAQVKEVIYKRLQEEQLAHHHLAVLETLVLLLYSKRIDLELSDDLFDKEDDR